MSDTTLIQRLRNCANEPWKHALRPIALEAADALEQQAAQIAEKDAEIARLRMLTCKCVENNTAANALRADAECLRALLSDVRSALDYHQEQTRPIHSTRTALDAIDAALRKG